MRLFWTLIFLSVPVVGVGAFVWAANQPGAWLPLNLSTVGAEVDFLFYVILGITGFFFVLTELLLVYALWEAMGKGAADKATFIHGNKWMEVFWTLGTAVILVFIALVQIPAWQLAKDSSRKPDRDPDVLITASQFLWQVRYPYPGTKLSPSNPDLSQSFELINELHVPPSDIKKEGDGFLIYLTSRDVQHAFWFPQVRAKQDAVPGLMIPVWFDVKYIGEGTPQQYEFYCAELCGWGHYRMRGKVVVHPSTEDYKAWLRKQAAPDQQFENTITRN